MAAKKTTNKTVETKAIETKKVAKNEEKMNDELLKKYMKESGVTFLPKTKLLGIEGDLFGCKVTFLQSRGWITQNGERSSVTSSMSTPSQS